MGNVLTDNLVEGMTVAHDVHDRSGRLLLGAGVELTALHLRMFRSWGIVEVAIAGGGTPEAMHPVENELEDQRLQELETELQPLFRNTNLSYPPMAELFRLCLLRKLLHESR